MGFFRTVYTLCTRTSAFPEMLGTPVWKAILHSILLLLICPLIIATVQTCREKKDCAGTLESLKQDSGGFGFRGNDMCFGGSFQERHYTFELFGSGMRLDYVTTPQEVQTLKPDHWKEHSGLLITKSRAIFWTKTPDFLFLFWEVPAEIMKSCFSTQGKDPELTSELVAIARNSESEPHTGAQLLETAEQSLTPEEKPVQAPPEKSAVQEKSAEPEKSAEQPAFEMQDIEYIKTMLLSLFWMYLFMQFFAEGILMFLLGGLCFAFMEFLYLRMMPNKLPFGKVYMLTLYAMFPALIVASLATLTGQTFLSFQTVFLIVFFIYQLFSFKALGLFLNPPDKRQQNNFPDDDDF